MVPRPLQLPKPADAQVSYIKCHRTLHIIGPSRVPILGSKKTVEFEDVKAGDVKAGDMRANCMFIEKHPCINGSAHFKPSVQGSTVF